MLKNKVQIQLMTVFKQVRNDSQVLTASTECRVTLMKKHTAKFCSNQVTTLWHEVETVTNSETKAPFFLIIMKKIGYP